MSDDTSDEPRAGSIDAFDRQQRRDRQEVERKQRSDLSDVFRPAGDKGIVDGDPTPLQGLVNYEGDPWLPRGKVGSLVAPGSTGKSQFLLQLAMCVSSANPDRQFLGTFDVPDRGPVVLALGEEADNDINRRIRAVLDTWQTSRTWVDPTDADRRGIKDRLYALGMADKRTALMQEPIPPWHVEDQLDRIARLSDGEMGEDEYQRRRGELLEGWTEMKRQWNDLLRSPPNSDGVPDWKAIMLDPASQFIGPEVEKDAAAATRFVQLLHTWAKRPWGNASTGPTVLTAHHASQSAGEDDRDVFLSNPYASRGTTALTDGVRWQANMYATEGCKVKGFDDRKVDVVSLQINKFNDGRAPNRIHVVRDDSIAFARGIDPTKDQVIQWPGEDGDGEGDGDSNNDFNAREGI